MSKLNEAWLGAQLHKLMTDKLGQYFDWKPPLIEDYVGPCNPEVLDKFNKYRQEIEDACKEMLVCLPDDDVLILFDSNLDDPGKVRKKWHSLQRNEIGRLEKNQPPWFARGFGHPDHVADFEYWGQQI